MDKRREAATSQTMPKCLVAGLAVLHWQFAATETNQASQCRTDHPDGGWDGGLCERESRNRKVGMIIVIRITVTLMIQVYLVSTVIWKACSKREG